MRLLESNIGRRRAVWGLVAVALTTFLVVYAVRHSESRRRPPVVVVPLTPGPVAESPPALPESNGSRPISSRPYADPEALVEVGPKRAVRVVDTTGAVLHEAVLFGVMSDRRPEPIAQRADRLFDVASGVDEVVASCRGFVPVRVNLAARCPDATTTCDVVLNRGRELRGIVVDEKGRAVVGAVVEATGRDPLEFPECEELGLVASSVAGEGAEAASLRRVRVGQDGKFEFDGLPAGQIHVRALAFGYLPESIYGWVRIEPGQAEAEQRVVLRRVFVSVVCIVPECPLGHRHRTDEVAVSARRPEGTEKTLEIEATQTNVILDSLKRRYAESRPCSIGLCKATAKLADADVSLIVPGSSVLSVTGSSFSFDRKWVPLNRFTASDVGIVRAFDSCAGLGLVRAKCDLPLRAVRLNSSGNPGAMWSVPVRTTDAGQEFDLPIGKYVIRSYSGAVIDDETRQTEPFEVVVDSKRDFDLSDWSASLRRVRVSVRDRFDRPTANYALNFEKNSRFVCLTIGRIAGSDFTIWLPRQPYRVVLLDAMSERVGTQELSAEASEIRLKL